METLTETIHFLRKAKYSWARCFLLIAGVALLCLSAHKAVAANKVPEIGGSFTKISKESEYLLGRSWLYAASGKMPILINAFLLEDYINQLVLEIAGYSNTRNISVKVVLLKDPTINAFAAPGGVIGINLGLITEVNSEDELASVIAHEFAHISQRHTLEIIENSKNRALLTQGAFWAGLGLMLLGSPEIGVASLLGGVANDANLTIDAVRLNEEEADSIAFETMIRAGRDPYAALRMAERLYRQNRDGSLPVAFRTHPLSSQRISSLRNRLWAYESKHGKIQKNEEELGNGNTQDIDFHTAQIMAKMHLAFDRKGFLEVLLKESEAHKEDNKWAYKLALANVYNEVDMPGEALVELKNVVKAMPLHYYANAALANAYRLQKKYDRAIDIVDSQLVLHPDNYMLHSVKVETLIDAGEYAKAQRLLENHVEKYPEGMWMWNRLYELYGKTGQIPEVHYAMGNIQFLVGNNGSAIHQLGLAAEKTKNQKLQSKYLEKIEYIRRTVEKLEGLGLK